jgi:hypothetical protein
VRVGRATLAVAEMNDDAEEDLKSGKMDLDSSDLELIQDKADQIVAVRFAAVNIPAGAHLRGAFLQFTADEVNDEPCALVIHGATDASALTRQDHNLSARARTTASVKWNPGPWTPKEAGSTERTPNLAPIVAELLSAPAWKAGQPVVFVITGKGKRVASALPTKDGKPARLLLEWEE